MFLLVYLVFATDISHVPSKEIAFWYPSLCTGRNTKPCSARPVPIFWYPKVPSDIRPVKIPTNYRSWLDLPLFTAPTAAPQGRVIAIAHQQEAELSGWHGNCGHRNACHGWESQDLHWKIIEANRGGSSKPSLITGGYNSARYPLVN